jgi:TRAP-type C4-dicarboxylate transport system permease small subunit
MFVALVTVAIMMIVISYDSISRYLLNSPLPWAFQVVSYYLMIIALYFAIPSTFTHGDHVSIDLFREKFSKRVRVSLDVVWSVMSACVFGIIAYASGTAMTHAYASNEFLPGHILWPVWLSLLPIVIGTALTALRLLHHAGRLIARGGDPDVSVEAELLP